MKHPTKSNKEPKYDIKVQKETVPKTVEFQPTVHHRMKGSKESIGGYMDSFKKIFEDKLFSKEKAKQAESVKSNKELTSQEELKLTEIQGNENSTTEAESNNEPTTERESLSEVEMGQILTKEEEQEKIDKISIECSEKEQEQFYAEYMKVVNSQYLRIKYIKKLSPDSILIGNENQIDMFQFKVENKQPFEMKKWSLNLDKPIEGVTVSKLAESKILLWTERELHIFECNHKNITERPKEIEKLTLQEESILSVQFVKKNIFLVCCLSHIEIYEFTEANKFLTIKKLNVMKWKCPEHFEVVEVPEHFGSNIKIFYANMKEYEVINDEELNKEKGRSKEKYKDNNSRSKEKDNNNNKLSSQNPTTNTSAISFTRNQKKKDVFGLYFVEIDYDYSKTKISELKKVYDIKNNLRYEIKLFNISQNIFFMNLKTEVLAVKNGLIIDSVGVNFKFDHCYLKIIENDVLVHILTDKIEFYRITLNYNVMPEKINVVPFDSIYFPRELSDEFLSIVPINHGYGVFFQHEFSMKKYTVEKLKKANINYWYALTYPIPLYEKLNEIFPSTEEIEETSFETLETLCDMSCKMGLTLSESYRCLWRKSKKETEKDYEILLLSRDYKTIQEEITLLLKKHAEKWRMINKNQEICLEFLRPRIFHITCKIENLEEFSSCHFFNLKLRAYKDIEVERRRFELEMYNKGKETSMETVNRLMQMFEVKELKEEYREEEGRLRKEASKKKLVEMKFSYEEQESEILSEGFDRTESYYEEGEEYSEELSPFNEPIKLLDPLPSQLSPPSPTKHHNINLFDTFLKTSKNFNQIEEDRKTAEVREKEKLRHELEEKMKEPDYNEIKINIKDYYFYRDTGLKQYFLETVAELMAKEHTQNDHLRYFVLRVLVRNFKLLFRNLYEEILLQMISTYRHKISRLIEHFMELLPYEYDSGKLPIHTLDYSLCQCIWNPIQSQEIEEMLFLTDITTIENKEIVEKLKETLWYKRNYLAHHGLVRESKEEVRQKYSSENMKHIQEHYFYLFISKFLEIKVGLSRELGEKYKANGHVFSGSNSNKESGYFMNENVEEFKKETQPPQPTNFLSSIIDMANNNNSPKLDKNTQETINKLEKELTRTNELLKRVEQIYPLIPEHLKGHLNLYYDLYNFLESFILEEKQYSSIYEFLRLRDFELFRIFFVIEKKSKGFLLKHILKKYEDPKMIENGREKFISGIAHYFDSELSEITDLKTILNRLNGQPREFHIQFEPLYDCLLEAMMKKIRISPSADINLDELLIYVHNIPFSTSNGRIFEKLLLIQEVHLEMEMLKRSRINMSIMEIRDCGEVVIGALVEAELRANKLVADFLGLGKEYTVEDAAVLMKCVDNNDNSNNKMKEDAKEQSRIMTKQQTGFINNEPHLKPTTPPTSPKNNLQLINQTTTLTNTQNQSNTYSPEKLLMTSIMSTVSKLSLTRIESTEELKMYFYKCISELQCIKRHLYGNSFKRLLGFVFVSELLLQDEYLIPLVGECLEDDDVKEMLEINYWEEEEGQEQEEYKGYGENNEKEFKKSIFYYCYRQRLSIHNKFYLASESYIKQLLNYLPFNDPERMLIEEEIKYCHLFEECEYDIPYPLTVIRQIPVLDEIEYHISQIKSEKIDKLNVEKLFNSMETMRELVEPNLSITTKSLTERVKEFERVLYEFVFFKYLREKKLVLALQMIDKLLILNPKENVMIYCVFVIDSLLEQFNDSTGLLLIKLVSYFYDHAEKLRFLLEELITRAFTTTQFEEYVKERINEKIREGSYRYFDYENGMLTQEVREMAKEMRGREELECQNEKGFNSNKDIKSNQINNKFINLCELLDTAYHHIEKSSEHIQQNKYFQLLYRLMLYNPYQASYFIYNKPEINIKAIRAFLTYISQETLLFNTEIVLKVGEILFVIIMNRISCNFMINQQVKEYEKLNLLEETFDEQEFVRRFNDSKNKETLTEMEKLVYDSYQGMKKKLLLLEENQIKEKINKELCKVKQLYDRDTFLVNKHNNMSLRKKQKISYLPYEQWLKEESKLKYYINNIDEYASYKEFAYLFASIDKDESYVIKGEEEFNCPKVTSWPSKVEFNKIKNRHDVLIEGRNTRIPALNKKENKELTLSINERRTRKPSAYLPEEFKLHKKSTNDLHKNLSVEVLDENNIKKPSEYVEGISNNINGAGFLFNVMSPKSVGDKNENNFGFKPPTSPKNTNNPILNFFNMGASFGNLGQYINQE